MFLPQKLSLSTLLLPVVIQLAWAGQFDDSSEAVLNPKWKASYIRMLAENPAARSNRLWHSQEVAASEQRLAEYSKKLQQSPSSRKSYIRLPDGRHEEPFKAILGREPLLTSWRKDSAGHEMHKADETLWSQAAMLREERANQNGVHHLPSGLGRSTSLPRGVLTGTHAPTSQAEKDTLHASWKKLHREAIDKNHARLGSNQLGRSVASGFGRPSPKSSSLDHDWKAFYQQEAQVHDGLRSKGLDPGRMTDAQWNQHAPIEHHPDGTTQREYFRKRTRLAGMGDPGAKLPVADPEAAKHDPSPAVAKLERTKSTGAGAE